MDKEKKPDLDLLGTQNYFNEMGKFDLLTAEEEKELFQKVEAGDMDAREKIINSNLRLPISEAKKYAIYDVPLNDLIQEGNLGLITAVDKFDLSKECRFSTYATYWVRQAIFKYFFTKTTLVHKPYGFVKPFKDIKKYIHDYSFESGNMPTEEEIIKDLNITKDILYAYNVLNANATSLDKVIGDDDDCTLIDFHVDQKYNVEKEVLDKIESDELIKLFNPLSKRERAAVMLNTGYYKEELVKDIYDLFPGFELEDRKYKLHEIGNLLGVSRQRAGQVITIALNKMKRYAEKLEKSANEKKEKIYGKTK